jgi:diguanylate cyclase (GGDEF)-like protein
LRFGVYLPCAALFLVLDHANRMGRFYDRTLLALAVLPGLISAVLCVMTTSTTAMADVRATVLILLSTGMVWRQTLPMVTVHVVISASAYVVSISLSPVVPSFELGTLIFAEVAVATTVIVYNFQIDNRNRRVFLLNMTQRIYRTELAAHNHVLLKQTKTDALTGVANRRCFDDTLAMAWQTCRDAAQPISLIMIDIDHFKKFNDYYGHQGGDECLTRVATRIRGQLRTGDLLARYGGEEFAVIAPCAEITRASDIARRIRSAVAEMALPHRGAGEGEIVTISVGVATLIPDDANGARGLIEMADHALYAAKRAGRNRVSVSTAPAISPTAQALMRLVPPAA